MTSHQARCHLFLGDQEKKVPLFPAKCSFQILLPQVRIPQLPWMMDTGDVKFLLGKTAPYSQDKPLNWSQHNSYLRAPWFNTDPKDTRLIAGEGLIFLWEEYLG